MQISLFGYTQVVIHIRKKYI